MSFVAASSAPNKCLDSKLTSQEVTSGAGDICLAALGGGRGCQLGGWTLIKFTCILPGKKKWNDPICTKKP